MSSTSRWLMTSLASAALLVLITSARSDEGQSTPQDVQDGHVLVSLTGHESAIAQPRWRLATSQETFDGEWIEHMGDRIERAAQGWPITPNVNFDLCQTVFVFGGDRTNANGYRLMEVVDSDDSLTIRYELISYQTASFDGPDRGNPVRPWSVFVIPQTGKTIILEENTQYLIGHRPIWTRRATLSASR